MTEKWINRKEMMTLRGPKVSKGSVVIMKTVNTDQIVLCVHGRDGRKGSVSVCVCVCVCMSVDWAGAGGGRKRMPHFHLLIGT